MLTTLARDVYSTSERRELWYAIDDLASPIDNMGFASNGVYIFFDPSAKSVLYIGLARDLATRFAQHNGIVKTSDSGCKRVQIDAWFDQHSTLGFALALASPEFQTKTGRQNNTPLQEVHDEESPDFFLYDPEGLTHIRDVEGQLIAGYQQRHGRLPPWNKIKGAEHKSNAPTPNTPNLLDLAIGVHDSLLAARLTIRDLQSNTTAYAYEEALHAARQAAAVRAFFERGTVTDSLVLAEFWRQKALQDQMWPDHENVFGRMVVDGYPWGIPPVPAEPVPLWEGIPELRQ